MQVWFSILVPGGNPEEQVKFHGPGYRLLDSQPFGPVTKLGPAVVYERFVDASDFPDPVSAFGGNIAGQPSRRDTTRGPAMSDRAFWDLVGAPFRLLSETGQSEVAAALGKDGDSSISAFELAFRGKLAALTSNGVPVMAGGDDSLEYWAAAVIAGGPQVYEAALRGDVVQLPSDWPSAERLLSIPSLAREIAGTPEGTGTAELLPPAQDRQPRLSRVAARNGIENPLADAWYNASLQSWWYANRHLLAVPGGFVEVVTFASTSEPIAALDTCASRRAVELKGSLLISDQPQRIAQTMGGSWITLFSVRRVTGLDIGDYLRGHLS